MNSSHMLSLTTQQSRTVPSARNKNKHISTSHTNLEEMSPLAVPKIFKSAPVKCTAFSTHLQLPARYPTLCLLASNPSKQSRWSYKVTWQVHRAWRLIHNCHRFKSIFGSPQELLGRFKTAVDGWYVTDLFKSRTGIFGSVKLQAWQGLELRVNLPCSTILAQPESLWIWQREWRIVRILFPRCPGQSAPFFAARWMITPKEKYAENAWKCRTTLSQHQDHRRTVHAFFSRNAKAQNLQQLVNRTKIDRAGRPMSFFTGQREHCFKPCWQKQPVECVYNLQRGRQKRQMSQALSRDVLAFSGASKKIRVARKFLNVSHQES